MGGVVHWRHASHLQVFEHRLPLKTVLFRDGGVSRVLTAFGAHKRSALRTVRPHVFPHTLRFSARGFLALTKNSLFLEVPIAHPTQWVSLPMCSISNSTLSPVWRNRSSSRPHPVPTVPLASMSPGYSV